MESESSWIHSNFQFITYCMNDSSSFLPSSRATIIQVEGVIINSVVRRAKIIYQLHFGGVCPIQIALPIHHVDIPHNCFNGISTAHRRTR